MYDCGERREAKKRKMGFRLFFMFIAWKCENNIFMQFLEHLRLAFYCMRNLNIKEIGELISHYPLIDNIQFSELIVGIYTIYIYIHIKYIISAVCLIKLMPLSASFLEKFRLRNGEFVGGMGLVCALHRTAAAES